jgi:hypothetical protein
LSRLHIALLRSLAACVSACAFVDPAVAQDRSIFSALDTGDRVVDALGVPARGALSEEDLIATGGRRIQVWRLDATVGDELQVDLRSGDFDAYVFVVGPGLGEGLADDDGGDGLNARVCVVVDEPGEYRVVASSLSSATGGYTLTARRRPGVTDGACPEEAGPAISAEVDNIADLPLDGRALGIGADAAGSLSAGDATILGSPAQAWALEGVAGQSVTVDLRSNDFDAYLMVDGPGLESWLRDDDGAGRCDSRITLDLPESGLYRVVASTLNQGMGEYRLLVSEEPGPVDEEACVPPSSTASYDEEAVATVGALSWEETHEGALTGTEGEYMGRLMQAWTVEAQAGTRVAIEVRSSDFDSYATLTGPGFEGSPPFNDDGGGNLNALLCAELPQSGTYRVLAGPYSGGEAGQIYSIRASVTEAAALCDEFELAPEAIAGLLSQLPTDGRSIALGNDVAGRLDPAADSRHPDTNHLIQGWSFDGQAGRTVYVDVISDDFDTVLYALGAGLDGVLFIDDADAGCNSRMSITPSQSGRILLFPGAYADSASGAYSLRVSSEPGPLEDNRCDFGAAADASGADPVRLAGVTSGEERPVPPVTIAEGTLGSDEQRLSSGEPAQPWSLPVTAGEELEITLISEVFDPVLYVDGAALPAPLMDDDSAGELDSRITLTVPANGVIRIVVSAFASDAAGDYEIRIVRRTP